MRHSGRQLPESAPTFEVIEPSVPAVDGGFIVAPTTPSVFEISSRETTETIRNPRGEQSLPWWDELNTECRVARAALQPLQSDLLRQDPETCWLTSTLNAFVLRRSMSPDEARAVQHTMLTDQLYQRYFTPGTQHWEVGNPGHSGLCGTGSDW